MYDVVSLGELLIDFIPDGISTQNNQLLEVNPGGAPCNVLALLSKLGKKTAFIGKVGRDDFGKLLKNTIEEIEIESKGLILSDKYKTTLAFIHLDSNGERSFTFYRGADEKLEKSDIDVDLLNNTKIFHFGSLSMTNDPAESSTIYAIEKARENGAIISFDPNLRPLLWNSLDKAKQMIMYGLKNCDIVKISDEEMEFVTGSNDVYQGSKILSEKYNINLVFVTMGSKGSMFRFGNITGLKEAYNNLNTIDTTGAGDTFCGCVLYKLLERGGFNSLKKEYLLETLDFANAAASIVTTRKGVINSMPTLEQIFYLQQYKNFK